MDVRTAIEVRKSVRSYLDTPIEEEKLALVMEAVRLAPTASNAQEQKVVVVQDAALREKLAEACRNQKMVAEAPVVLVVCANNQRMMPCEQPAHTVDASIVASFIMLQATELGLSTCWLGAFFTDQVRPLLNVPEEYAIVAVMPIGYAAAEGRERDRKDLVEFFVEDTF